MHLIVIQDFDGRKRGDIITDIAEMAKVRTSENAEHVVAVETAPVTPEDNH